MKFGKRLQEEMIPEWVESYVSYKRLKHFIHNTELRGTAFSDELFRIIYEELAKAEKLGMELMEELELVHGNLLDCDVDQRLVPSASGKFYRKRRVASATDLLQVGEGSAAAPSEALSTTGDDFNSGGMLSAAKRFFLKLIGDSKLATVEENTMHAQFLEWYSHAHQLLHFAELNLEAIRKASKKLKKYRKCEPDYTLSIEAVLSRSRLTVLMPRLHTLVADVEVDFERKFKKPLDRYADVTLSEVWHAKWRYVLLAVFLFLVAMGLPIFLEHPAAHNCVALFVLVIVLWITEAIPFFCTAMLIPIVAVPLRIISTPGTHNSAGPTVASQILLSNVFNHVQILVMGGLTIGKACGRTNLEMYAASALHRLTAHRPSLYLLGIMLSSCFLSAFVSNVAAPLLVLGVIQQTLWEFPDGTNAPHGILLGLAFACNLGGMLSPIASPQNAVAMTVLSFHNVSFAGWVAVAFPAVLVTVLAAWAIILHVWKPFENVTCIPLQVVSVQTEKAASMASRVIVLVVSLCTVILWILPANLFFGDTGIVALIPIVVFFGLGILSKDDFNTLSWHLMFLLAGGNMLGLCARDSQMLDILANSLKDTLTTSPPYATLVVVIGVVGVVTTFVSHTVAAMIMLPIIVKIGFLMPKSDEDAFMVVTPQSLVLLAALMCSGAMAFPISSFPNVNSLLAEDEKGRAYLKAKDFLVCGTAVTLVFSACVFTWMVPYTNYILGS